jgi:hypothetical protein
VKKIGWPLVAAAVILVLATLVCVMVGTAKAARPGGQTPTESYSLTLALTLISVAAGWVISGLFARLARAEKEADDLRRQQDLDRTTRSAVVRIFRIMREFGQIQGMARDSGDRGLAELRTRMREIDQIARVSFDSANDSIADWRRLAADAVDDELNKAIEGQVGDPDGE